MGIVSKIGDVTGWLMKGVIFVEIFILLFYALHAAGTHFGARDSIASAKAATAMWVPFMQMGLGLGAVLGLVMYFKRGSVKSEWTELMGWWQFSAIAVEMFILLVIGSLHFETGLKYFEWLWLFAISYVFSFVLGIYGYKRGSAERMERLYGKAPAKVQ